MDVESEWTQGSGRHRRLQCHRSMSKELTPMKKLNWTESTKVKLQFDHINLTWQIAFLRINKCTQLEHRTPHSLYWSIRVLPVHIATCRTLDSLWDFPLCDLLWNSCLSGVHTSSLLYIIWEKCWTSGICKCLAFFLVLTTNFPCTSINPWTQAC